jgi:hypothetical protein
MFDISGLRKKNFTFVSAASKSILGLWKVQIKLPQ